MEDFTIDLTQGKRSLAEEQLNESWMRMFGSGVSAIIRAMFGGSKIPVTVKGTRSEVQSFANVLGKEKGYMDAYQNNGLDNPQTYRSKFTLNKAIKDFERKTGLTYPLR